MCLVVGANSVTLLLPKIVRNMGSMSACSWVLRRISPVPLPYDCVIVDTIKNQITWSIKYCDVVPASSVFRNPHPIAQR